MNCDKLDYGLIALKFIFQGWKRSFHLFLCKLVIYDNIV